LLLVFLVAVLSYVASVLGGMLALRPQMVWPIWPGCAFLVAVLLLSPRELWLRLMVAGMAGFVLYDLQAGLPSRAMALLILADLVEILIATLGVSYLLGVPPELDSIKSLSIYALFAVILAPLTAAFVANFAYSGDYWIHWRIGFLTEALALLTLTPAILSWTSVRRVCAGKPRAYYLEAAALLIGLMIAGYLAFIDPGRSSEPVLLYSILPFLLWSALRFRLLGASTSIIIVAFLSVWGAVHGRGPFVEPQPLTTVMSLQLFLFFAATPFMVLSVLMEERRQTELAFRESEKRFRLVADTAPVLIWMAGTDKLCTYFNQPWLDFTGRPLDFELGNGWSESVHPEDLQVCMETYIQAFDRHVEFSMEYRLRRVDGEYRWLLDVGVPRFNPDGSFAGYIGSCIDVTQRKQAEEDLRVSEDQLRLLLDSTAEAIYGIDLKGRCTFCNAACLRDLGYERVDQLFGKRMHNLIHHSRADGSPFPLEECKILQTFHDGAGIHVDDEVLWKADGTSFPAEYWSYPQRRGQEIVGAVVAFLDITQRKLAEEALASVSRRLIKAQEEERTRIARELHDDMGQRLALLTIELEQLIQGPFDLSAQVKSRLVELRKQTFETATDIQTLSHELHSSKLEYLGLVAAMRGFCREFGEQQKSEVEFTTRDLPSPVPPDVSLCLFRVMQEALHNCAKHSGVRHFEVKLWGSPGELHLEVKDSGSGFDREAARESRGLGLVSMEERLKLMNGSFFIDSQLSRGTTIHARVPLRAESNPVRAAS
jgi:PAS domain S-box-containing protein